jgi:hypothetical protein
MRWTMLFAFVFTAGACDHRPIAAAFALVAPGDTLPVFTFPRSSGAGLVSQTDARGEPTLLALWSTHCPFQGPSMAALDTLVHTCSSHGVRFIVLADDTPGAVLDSALAASRWHIPSVDVGVASGAVASVFDRSSNSTERTRFHVEFVLPSFLLLNSDGTVVMRSFGASVGGFRPTIGSLLRSRITSGT